jgi:hypothetical protein
MWKTYETGPKKRPLQNVSIVNFITEFILNFSLKCDFWRKLCSSRRVIALVLQVSFVVCLFANHMTSGHDASLLLLELYT